MCIDERWRSISLGMLFICERWCTISCGILCVCEHRHTISCVILFIYEQRRSISNRMLFAYEHWCTISSGKLFIYEHRHTISCEILDVYEHWRSIFLFLLFIYEHWRTICFGILCTYEPWCTIPVFERRSSKFRRYRVPQLTLIDVKQQCNVLRPMRVGATYGIHHLIDNHFLSWFSWVEHLLHALYDMFHSNLKTPSVPLLRGGMTYGSKLIVSFCSDLVPLAASWFYQEKI